MSRAARLLSLLQALRRRRTAVTAADLAAELGVSVRTIYRDIATLAGEGAVIDGEAGVGYLMNPDAFLPPLRFDRDEIEALVLGLNWVCARTDPALSAAAADALAKISAVLPESERDAVYGPGAVVGPTAEAPPATVPIETLREAIRRQSKLSIIYSDAGGVQSGRVIWPIALAFPEGARLLVSWCALRTDFRTFRVDRILGAQPTGERYSTARRILLAQFRAQLDAAAPAEAAADGN
jgi:predicted DNA-binding transcriptional regulator YafY